MNDSVHVVSSKTLGVAIVKYDPPGVRGSTQ